MNNIYENLPKGMNFEFNQLAQLLKPLDRLAESGSYWDMIFIKHLDYNLHMYSLCVMLHFPQKTQDHVPNLCATYVVDSGCAGALKFPLLTSSSAATFRYMSGERYNIYFAGVQIKKNKFRLELKRKGYNAKLKQMPEERN